MSMTDRWEALERKCRSIERRGMTPLIVTQFAFDADIVLAWLKALRERGIEHPVRVGVPGPASIAVLARYAALCGVLHFFPFGGVAQSVRWIKQYSFRTEPLPRRGT